MNNINPFLNNGINSRQNVANQNNGALNYNVRIQGKMWQIKIMVP